jgi:hypothetical protein
MALLTKDKMISTVGREGRLANLPVDDESLIYKGAMVAQLTATGMAVPGSTASSGRCVGIAQHQQSAIGAAADGSKRVLVEWDRVFELDNGGGADAFSDASPMFATAWMIDDQTVGDNDGGATRQIAGTFVGFSENGKVKVYIGPYVS